MATGVSKTDEINRQLSKVVEDEPVAKTLRVDANEKG